MQESNIWFNKMVKDAFIELLDLRIEQAENKIDPSKFIASFFQYVKGLEDKIEDKQDNFCLIMSKDYVGLK